MRIEAAAQTVGVMQSAHTSSGMLVGLVLRGHSPSRHSTSSLGVWTLPVGELAQRGASSVREMDGDEGAAASNDARSSTSHRGVWDPHAGEARVRGPRRAQAKPSTPVVSGVLCRGSSSSGRVEVRQVVRLDEVVHIVCVHAHGGDPRE